MKTLISIISVIVVLMAGTIGFQYSELSQKQPVGSVNTANEYHHTFTGTAGLTTQLISATPVTLGSVVITGASTGQIVFYNATTTDATKRTTAATTSLPVLANFPVSAAVGTYTFDVFADKGLLVTWQTAVGTSTITWR